MSCTTFSSPPVAINRGCSRTLARILALSIHPAELYRCSLLVVFEIYIIARHERFARGSVDHDPTPRRRIVSNMYMWHSCGYKDKAGSTLNTYAHAGIVRLAAGCKMIQLVQQYPMNVVKLSTELKEGKRSAMQMGLALSIDIVEVIPNTSISITRKDVPAQPGGFMCWETRWLIRKVSMLPACAHKNST